MDNKLIRNEHGLFDHIEYKYDEYGYVDWKAMIPKEFLVPNKERFKDKTEDEVEALDINTLDEDDLLILLGGIKYLSRLRGYSKLKTKVIQNSEGTVFCECHITWIPNFETEGREISFTGVGEAASNNTKGIGKLFLGPTAENRAFARCVRNFLGIEIAANAEVVGSYTPSDAEEPKNVEMAPSIGPIGLLEKALKEKKSNFTALKRALIEEGGKEGEKAAKWESIEDIPERTAFGLLSRIKKSPKKRGRPSGSKNKSKG